MTDQVEGGGPMTLQKRAVMIRQFNQEASPEDVDALNNAVDEGAKEAKEIQGVLGRDAKTVTRLSAGVKVSTDAGLPSWLQDEGQGETPTETTGTPDNFEEERQKRENAALKARDKDKGIGENNTVNYSTDTLSYTGKQ